MSKKSPSKPRSSSPKKAEAKLVRENTDAMLASLLQNFGSSS
jgi:hypothetical protein